MSSYKLRLVAKDWDHPKDQNDNYIPLFDGSYAEYSAKFDEQKAMWEKGFKENMEIKKIEGKHKFIFTGWVPKEEGEEGYTFEEYSGKKRGMEDYRPDWPKVQITHFQMYEDMNEGTPISPVFEKIEDLALWLCQKINDDRYPYTTSQWLEILTSDHPAVEMI